jgi:hypothetical protein
MIDNRPIARNAPAAPEVGIVAQHIHTPATGKEGVQGPLKCAVQGRRAVRAPKTEVHYHQQIAQSKL